MIVKHTQTEAIEPALYLLQHGWPQHGWGHKCVSHKDEVDIPRSLLSLLPPATEASDQQWRGLVARHHQEALQKKAKTKAIGLGDMFEWNGGRLVVNEVHPDGKHLKVVHEIERNGQWWSCKEYRAKRSILVGCKPIAQIHSVESTEPIPDAVQNEEQQELLFA